MAASSERNEISNNHRITRIEIIMSRLIGRVIVADAPIVLEASTINGRHVRGVLIFPDFQSAFMGPLFAIKSDDDN